jgi:hypothetical protein
MSDYWQSFGLDIGFIDHDSGLQAITAPPLIFTIHKLSQHPLNIFQPAMSLPAVPWQRLLTVEILQLQRLKSSLHRLQYKIDFVVSIMFLITPLNIPRRNPSFQEYLYRRTSIRCCRNVFTEPLPRNGSGIFACQAVVV